VDEVPGEFGLVPVIGHLLDGQVHVSLGACPSRRR
jgi:hypothetical protein